MHPPLPHPWEVSSPFGPREHPTLHRWHHHDGVDFAVSTGTPVYAVEDGLVSRVDVDGVGKGRVNGNAVFLRGTSGTWAYLHLSESLVRPGERVTDGQLLGRTGSTGRSTGPHLHLALIVDGRYQDPLVALERGPGEPKPELGPPGLLSSVSEWLSAWWSPSLTSWSSSVEAYLDGEPPGPAVPGRRVLSWSGGSAEVSVVEGRGHHFDGERWEVR